jgi:hypothetical protein
MGSCCCCQSSSLEQESEAINTSQSCYSDNEEILGGVPLLSTTTTDKYDKNKGCLLTTPTKRGLLWAKPLAIEYTTTTTTSDDEIRSGSVHDVLSTISPLPISTIPPSNHSALIADSSKNVTLITVPLDLFCQTPPSTDPSPAFFNGSPIISDYNLDMETLENLEENINS